MNMQTIVIDREYGSGGREVARMLSDRLGRCADELLKGIVPLLRVFIYSNDEFKKAQRISDIEGMPVTKAAVLLNKKDVQRANYYHFFTDRKWGDPVNYDVCINTGSITYENAADMIMSLLDMTK